jgi:hypothetical protein
MQNPKKILMMVYLQSKCRREQIKNTQSLADLNLELRHHHHCKLRSQNSATTTTAIGALPPPPPFELRRAATTTTATYPKQNPNL